MESAEEDVGGFDVAVDYPLGVQVCEAGEEGVEDGFLGLGGEWLGGFVEEGAEVVGHEGENEDVAVVLLERGEEGDDGGVLGGV